MPSIGYCVTQYIAARGELAKASRDDYRCQLERFAFDLGWRRPIEQVRQHQLMTWLGRPGWAPATRRTRCSQLRGLFRWCLLNGHVKIDPTVGLQYRVPRAVPRALRQADVRRLLAVCPDERARFIVMLMCQQGLRCVEVARLQMGDIDFGERVMLVHGKGGHQRVLPIMDETWTALVAYLHAAPAAAGPLVRSYLHPDRAISQRYISGMLRRWLRTAGVKRAALDGVSAHALRHTMATDMVRRGAHVIDVQHALGHLNLATTQRYLPWLVGDLREAMAGRQYAGDGQTIEVELAVG